MTMGYFKAQREYYRRYRKPKPGILLGSKKTAYYNNEMMYGQVKLKYKLSELSKSEKELINII